MKGLIVLRNWERFIMIQNKITSLSFCVVFTSIQYSLFIKQKKVNCANEMLLKIYVKHLLNVCIIAKFKLAI